MNKTVLKVFLVIALLVLIFVVWALFFNDNGILQTGYNSLVEPINDTWQKITGGSSKLLPTWGDVGVQSQSTNLGETTNGF